MKRLVFLFALILGSNLCWGQTFEEYKKKAEAGDATAQYFLATKYEDGEGCEKNYERACYWYQKAGDNGEASGYVQLADGYALGRLGLTENNEKAIGYYLKAANMGDGYSCSLVGKAYLSALFGLPKDVYKGKEYIEKAVKLGFCTQKDLDKANFEVSWWESTEAPKIEEKKRLAEQQALAKQEEVKVQAEKQKTEESLLAELQGNNDAAVKSGNN